MYMKAKSEFELYENGLLVKFSGMSELMGGDEKVRAGLLETKSESGWINQENSEVLEKGFDWYMEYCGQRGDICGVDLGNVRFMNADVWHDIMGFQNCQNEANKGLIYPVPIITDSESLIVFASSILQVNNIFPFYRNHGDFVRNYVRDAGIIRENIRKMQYF